jgi:hypothetical protein
VAPHHAFIESDQRVENEMKAPLLLCKTLRRCGARRLPQGLLAAVCGVLLTAAGSVGADSTRVTLRMDPRHILEAVARQMNVTLDPDEPLPAIHLESAVPLQQFQDAVVAQWNFRPPKVANVYVIARNEIYLSDDSGYYQRVRRTLDESLAHEFAHYLQVRYSGADLADDAYETEAVAVQFAFRDKHRLTHAAATSDIGGAAS